MFRVLEFTLQCVFSHLLPGRWGEAVSKLSKNVAAGDFGEAGRADGLCYVRICQHDTISAI